MLTPLLIFAATYFAAIADTTLAPGLGVYGMSPCFILLTVVIAAVGAVPTPWRVAQFGIVGLIFDLNSGGHAGVGIVCVSLIAAVLIRWRTAVRRFGIAEQTALTAGAVFGTLFAVAAGNWLFNDALVPLKLVLPQALGAAIYTAAVSIPAWLIVAWRRDARRAGFAVGRGVSMSR